MKRRLLPFILCLLLFLLPACAASAEGTTFLIEKTLTQTFFGTASVTEYFYDDVIVRGNGIVEIQGRKIENGEERSMRWLYTESGVPLGTRTYEITESGTSYSDTLNYLFYIDNTFESYVDSLFNVDRVEGDTVYFTDGAQEVILTEDGVISKTIRVEADGSISELMLTPYGLLEEMLIFNPGETDFFLHMQIEYAELNLSDFMAE